MTECCVCLGSSAEFLLADCAVDYFIVAAVVFAVSLDDILYLYFALNVSIVVCGNYLVGRVIAA